MGWKSLPKPLEKYEVNEYGTIMFDKKKIVSSYLDKTGYWRCITRDSNGKRKAWGIHQLVALGFLGFPSSKKLIVHHVDGNRENNNPENLRYITHKENHEEAVASGRKPAYPGANGRKVNYVRGEKVWQAKINQEVANKIKELVKNKIPSTQIAKSLGVSIHIVKDIRRGKTWK